jgi:hypothetical protein
MSAKELIDRKWNAGTRVTNCVMHMGRKIDERPDDCGLCLTDLRNHFNYALAVNDWLNQWKTDAELLLKKL